MKKIQKKFKLFIYQGLNFKYDSSQCKLIVNSRSGKVIEAPEVLQIAYQAKTILTYRQKIELTALLIGYQEEQEYIMSLIRT